MTSPYILAGYFVYWLFPTASDRLAAVPLLSEVGKVALQYDNNTLWVLTSASPLEWVAVGNSAYTPVKSFDGEDIPANYQRIVEGDFEIVGELNLTGDLVLI